MPTAREVGDSPERDTTDALGLLIDGATNYAIYMLDPEGRVAIWNLGAERIKGWTEAEIVGRSAEVFYTREDVAAGRPRNELDRARVHGKIEEESFRVRKDGSQFLADVTITALYAGNGELYGFGKVVRDITDKRAAEVALAQRETELASILATVPEAMAVLDEYYCITSFSKTAEQLFGYSEQDIVGRLFQDLMVVDTLNYKPLNSAMPMTARRIMGIRKDGKQFPFELAIGMTQTKYSRGFTAFMRDLSQLERTDAELQRLQSELSHAARVSALGAMGSTLAHELNQPMTAVVNYAEAARDLLAMNSSKNAVSDVLASVVAEAMRAGTIVRQLRSFIARGEVEKESCDLPGLIRETARLSSTLMRANDVVIHLDFGRGAEKVLAERIQVQQVLFNLMRNAVEAMAGSRERRLTVRTSRENNLVSVTVCDTGCGVKPEMANGLFEAFNSDKIGGMGVGLSICRTIVEAHGGTISADIAPPGVRINFCLPAMDAEDDA